MSERKSLEKQLQRARRYCDFLRMQKAGYGLRVPADLELELEEKEQEVADLEARLQELEPEPKPEQNSQAGPTENTISEQISFHLQREFRNAFKRYLVYFEEFVYETKNEQISFEVKTIQTGLEIKFEAKGKEELARISSYLQEYVSFAGKANLDDLEIETEDGVSPMQARMTVVELKSQVSNLRNSLEVKQFKIDYLQQQVSDFKELLVLKYEHPPQTTVNVQSSFSQSTVNQPVANTGEIEQASAVEGNAATSQHENSRNIDTGGGDAIGNTQGDRNTTSGTVAREIQQPGVEELRSDSRYRKLEEYLKAGQFREADKETRRLMLQTVGKDESQYLTEEDLEIFPCDELYSLDRLWLDGSGGLFGFSVQTKIYEELGGTKKFDAEVYIQFAKQVGWYIDGDFLDYNQLTFSLDNAVRGHFPVMVGYLYDSMIGSFFILVFWRMRSCRNHSPS